MSKGQLGVLSEVFLLVLILSIFVLFWNFYTRSNFLVGLLKVQSTEAVHTCSQILFPLVSTEYIKSTTTDELTTVDYFKDYLGMSESVTYPSPEYLLTK